MTSPSVIIIGAGAAGLAAASQLIEEDIEVCVLEARERLGGRIHTDATTFGVPVDLGASWIHGHKRNPLMRLARKHGIPIEVTPYEELALYDGTQRLSQKKTREAHAHANWLYDWAEKLCYRHPKSAPDISLAAAMGDALSREGDLDISDARFFDWGLSLLTLEEGIEAGEVTLRYWEDDDPFTGEDYLMVDGYRRLIDVLARGVDVRTGEVVEEVEWGEEQVRVRCASGEVVEGTHCLVTLPLGVLQHGGVQFTPELPEEKRRAIDGLGAGMLNKIAVRFESAFWPKKDAIVAKLDEPRGPNLHMLNLWRPTRRPILVGYWGGKAAREAEHRSDGELLEEFLTGLRAMFGDAVTPVEDVAITRWAQDPFARGAYAYIPVGATGRFYDWMAREVDDTLYFAGEATTRDHPGTVHGALLSGRREATKLTRRIDYLHGT